MASNVGFGALFNIGEIIAQKYSSCFRASVAEHSQINLHFRRFSVASSLSEGGEGIYHTTQVGILLAFHPEYPSCTSPLKDIPTLSPVLFRWYRLHQK